MTLIHAMTVKATMVTIVSMFILYQICPALPLVAPMLVSLVIMSTYPECSVLGKEYTEPHKQAWAIQIVLLFVATIILFWPCI